MRAKSFQILVLTSVLSACVARPVKADDDSSFNLGPNHVAPAKAVEEAVSLLPNSSKWLVSAAEMDMVKKIAAHDKKGFGETDTILIVANIFDDKSRKRYRAKIDKIADEARQAVANAKTDNEKADLLVKFLHQNPLRGGYEATQNDMRILLDKGTYNCVTSAILFNVIGHRLGLNTLCDTIPGHVFLRMGDLCIEPTVGWVQNEKDHKKTVDDMWNDEGSKPYYKNVFGKTRIYERGNLNLIGEGYAARAVKYCNDHRYEEYAITSLKALCLDSKDRAYANRASDGLKDWFLLAIHQKDYDKAQKIAGIYGQLFGDSSKIMFDQVAAARKGLFVANI